MSLFIATGTNLGDRRHNLETAKTLLQKKFELIAVSRIYESSAVDYLDQPDFYNQVLEFKIPNLSPEEAMSFLLETEKAMGRQRAVAKGPRLIDLDILFWQHLVINTTHLQLPHPRLFERSFVVLPLSELPGFQELKKHFSFPQTFTNSSTPLD